LISHIKGRTQIISEKRALVETVGPKREDGDNCAMKSFVICIFYKLILGVTELRRMRQPGIEGHIGEVRN
jgi:hypothetical protein